MGWVLLAAVSILWATTVVHSIYPRPWVLTLLSGLNAPNPNRLVTGDCRSVRHCVARLLLCELY